MSLLSLCVFRLFPFSCLFFVLIILSCILRGSVSDVSFEKRYSYDQGYHVILYNVHKISNHFFKLIQLN